MSDYIDFAVVGKVIATGLLLGAGLPLVFALGLRSLSVGTVDGAASTAGGGSFQVTKNPGALVVAVVCFAVVAAAIVFGIYIITNKG
ncbi:MAG: hypothetical protein JWO46_3253 [Nocardioidaceae bacterium]|nr:hypothetical protein [Nocardioidaceae bacterium]